VFFGDFTWPCSSLLADMLDQQATMEEVKDATAPLKKLIRLLFLGNLSVDPAGEHYGLPSPASEVPGMGLAPAMLSIEPMTLIHRLQNLVFREISRLIVNMVMMRPYTVLRNKYITDKSKSLSFTEATHQTPNLILVPLVWGVDPPRALPPNWKAINPVLPQPAQPLPTGMEEWIHKHCNDKQGLVLVSFGTQVTLSDSTYGKMLGAFSKLSKEFCFVWKRQFDSSSDSYDIVYDDSSTNSHILELPWIPQNDLLGHASTVAFVSHVGYGSLYEAAYHGVPVVAIPQFGDQEDNAQRPVLGGWGVVLNKITFTEKDLTKAVQTVANNDSIQTRANAISALVQEESGTEQVVHWIEYVVRHGGVDHLVPFRSMRASYAAYYNLDVGMVLMTLFLGFMYVSMILVKRCCAKHRSKAPSTGTETKDKKE